MNPPTVPELPAQRTCINCSCAARMNRKGEYLALTATDPDSFLVCRRDPPQASEMRQRRARVDPVTGKPQYNAQRQLMYEEVVAVQIGYRATLPEATCYDAWRPLGTPPGARWESQRMLEALLPLMERALVQSGVSAKAARELGDAMLTGIMPPRTQ